MAGYEHCCGWVGLGGVWHPLDLPRATTWQPGGRARRRTHRFRRELPPGCHVVGLAPGRRDAAQPQRARSLVIRPPLEEPGRKAPDPESGPHGARSTMPHRQCGLGRTTGSLLLQGCNAALETKYQMFCRLALYQLSSPADGGDTCSTRHAREPPSLNSDMPLPHSAHREAYLRIDLPAAEANCCQPGLARQRHVSQLEMSYACRAR